MGAVISDIIIDYVLWKKGCTVFFNINEYEFAFAIHYDLGTVIRGLLGIDVSSMSSPNQS